MARDGGVQDPGCPYGARYIRRSYRALAREAGTATQDGDREQVHRMRVASRRLRAALPVFSSCFGKDRYRTWFSDIRGITSALGRARDLDVQIIFLEDLQRRALAGALPRVQPDESRQIGRGVGIIRSGLLSERKKLQSRVGEIGALLETDRFREFEEVLAKMAARKGKEKGSIERRAIKQLEKRTGGVIFFERWVTDPGAVARHHEMRIAVKKLRYTMEIFDRYYRGFFKAPLRKIKRLQEILGIMHDCDVWIGWLPVFAGRAKRRRKTGGDDLEAAVEYILVERRTVRNERYTEFSGLWKDLREGGFFPALIPDSSRT